VEDAIIVEFKDVNAPNCSNSVHDLLVGFLKKEDFPNFHLIPGQQGNTFSVLLL